MIEYNEDLFFDQLTIVADYLESNKHELIFDMGIVEFCVLGYAKKLGLTQIYMCPISVFPQRVYEYLYNFDWKYIDNSIESAINRIRTFVANKGVPEGFSVIY